MPVASGNVPIKYKELPGGFQGTDETVREMTKVAMGKYGARSPKIRALARNILAAARIPEKNYEAEACALARWVRLNIRYLRDPYGQETLSHPEETAFNSKAEDCDGQAALLAALLGSVGIPSRFKVMGTTPFQYSHVYLQAQPNDGKWITFDPIMTNKPEGWEVPRGQRAIEKTYPVNTPDGWSGMQGVGMALGYVADPRVVSFLDEPVIPRKAGTGQQPGRLPAPPHYVSMPSGLDTDQGVDHMMAFPPNQNAPRHQGAPRARRIDPVLRRVGYDIPGSMDDDSPAFEAMDGGHEVMGPDALAGMDVIGAINRQGVPAQLQTHALRQAPEGVDLQFARAGMVTDSRRGDVIQWRGTPSKAQRPPIRAYTGVAGLERTLPGMGMFPGMAGPGMGEEATGNEDEPWPSDIPPSDLIGPEVFDTQMPPEQMPPGQMPPAQMPVDNILTRQSIAGIPNWALLASAVGVLIILRKRK